MEILIEDYWWASGDLLSVLFYYLSFYKYRYVYDNPKMVELSFHIENYNYGCLGKTPPYRWEQRGLPQLTEFLKRIGGVSYYFLGIYIFY